MTDKTMDEHAAAVERRNDVPLDRAYANILAAYEAERAARIDLERQYLCAKCQHNEARVRELEAERDAAVARAEVAEAAEKSAAKAWEPLCDQRNAAHALLDHVRTALGLSLFVSDPHAELPRLVAEAVADLAATRAQLERLREAALMLADRVRAEGGHGHRVHELSDRVLDALSTPGPTLASVRAEALRDAARRWMADHENSTSAEHVHDWLRQRADDLEAGRG